MTFQEHITRGNKIIKELKQDLANGCDKEILLYGIGSRGNSVCEALLGEIKIAGFCMTNKTCDKFKGLPVYTPDEIPQEKYKILLTLSEKHWEGIQSILESNGQTDIMPIDMIMQNSIMAPYYKRLLDKFQIDISQPFCVINQVKIRNPFLLDERDLQSALIEISDLLFGDILHLYDLNMEGPYLYLDVTLHKGDVVLDCGANLGFFSAVAASQGCVCYAFEPTERICQDLSIYDEIYPGQIIPCQFALSDSVGTVQLALSETGDAANTIIMDKKNSNLEANVPSEILKVKTTTVDAFVEQERLTHVDFIKADIEGAERLMLKGARKTLAKFGPKIAICTYHFNDDPQVLEQLILEANPNYVIEHRWKKLYAHVPVR